MHIQVGHSVPTILSSFWLLETLHKLEICQAFQLRLQALHQALFDQTAIIQVKCSSLHGCNVTLCAALDAHPLGVVNVYPSSIDVESVLYPTSVSSAQITDPAAQAVLNGRIDLLCTGHDSEWC